MKRKPVLIVLTLAVVLLATPYVGMAQAGKGQEKLDFKIHMVGVTQGPPEKIWQADDTMHIRGMGFVITGDFYIEIGEAGAVETIPKAELGYVASLDINVNQKEGFYVINVRETFIVYTDSGKSTERGRLELLSLGGLGPTTARDSFTGFGTGEFEGAKVSGETTSTPGPPLTLDRIGTVMGWP